MLRTIASVVSRGVGRSGVCISSTLASVLSAMAIGGEHSPDGVSSTTAAMGHGHCHHFQHCSYRRRRQGADDNYSATGLASEPGTGDAQVSGDATDSQTSSQSEAAFSAADDSRSSDPLRAERRKTNQLEKEIRTLKQQLNRFSEINPEEYSRLQDAERQKQILEQQVELRERQMEEASAQKVAAVAAERDDAKQQILQLRKERLLERVLRGRGPHRR